MIDNFEQNLKNKLEVFRQVEPGRQSLQQTLDKITDRRYDEFVTKDYFSRYIYSMRPAFVLLVLIVLAGIGAFVYFGNKGNLPQTPLTPGNGSSAQIQTVTTNNVDSALSQTDTQMQQSIDQVDQDLKQLDSQTTSEEDAQNL